MNCDRCGKEIAEDYRAPWQFGPIEGVYCSPECRGPTLSREEVTEKFADVLEQAAELVDKAKGTNYRETVEELKKGRRRDG